MELTAVALSSRLKKQVDSRYLIYGKEQFMVERCCEVIRDHARDRGHQDRLVLTISPEFKWQTFDDSLNERSLFSTQKLIELRLPASGLLGKAGSKSMCTCLESIDPDTIVLAIGGEWLKKVKATKWFREWVKNAVVVNNPGFQHFEFRNWIQSQLERNHIQHESAVVDRMAYYFEGNMLAAANELRKLRMAYDGTPITVKEINKIVIDQARFSNFALIDACLDGDLERSIRLLQVMRNEGTEPIRVLWALAREARIIYQIAQAAGSQSSVQRIFEELRIWSARRARIMKAVNRLELSGISSIMQKLALADQILKGRNSDPAVGTIWDQCERIILGFCQPRNYINFYEFPNKASL